MILSELRWLGGVAGDGDGENGDGRRQCGDPAEPSAAWIWDLIPSTLEICDHLSSVEARRDQEGREREPLQTEQSLH